MDFDLVKAKFFQSKSGALEEEELVYVKSELFLGRQWYFYECPCGGEDHYATRAMIKEGFSQFLSTILNCFCTEQQWLIRPIDTANLICLEEKKYFELLKKSENIVRKIISKQGFSEKTIAFLKDTHGIDREIVECIISS